MESALSKQSSTIILCIFSDRSSPQMRKTIFFLERQWTYNLSILAYLDVISANLDQLTKKKKKNMKSLIENLPQLAYVEDHRRVPEHMTRWRKSLVSSTVDHLPEREL